MHAFCTWPQLKGQSVLGMTANKIHKDKLRFKTVDLWLGTTPVDADVQKYVLVAEVDTAELDFLHLACLGCHPCHLACLAMYLRSACAMVHLAAPLSVILLVQMRHQNHQIHRVLMLRGVHGSSRTFSSCSDLSLPAAGSSHDSARLRAAILATRACTPLCMRSPSMLDCRLFCLKLWDVVSMFMLVDALGAKVCHSLTDRKSVV